MIVKMFAIRDAKTETYMQPFFSPTTAAAIRSFAQLANDPNSSVGQWPDDFTLFELGSFEDSVAMFETHSPHSLGLASEHQQAPVAPNLKEVV